MEPEMQGWLKLNNPEEKMNDPLTKEIEFAIDRFYFNHYCQSFRSGAFARANSLMYSMSVPVCAHGLYNEDPDGFPALC